MIKVLMTGGGAPGGPGIIKALKRDPRIDLLVVDADTNASGRFLNDKFQQIPLANDPNFCDELVFLCQKFDIDVIFPLVTKELFVLSKEKERFENIGTKIIVSEYDNLKIANDKSAICNHLKSNGILTPDFVVVNTFDQLLKGFDQLGFPSRPLCIKPSVSNGSRGVRIIDNRIDDFDLLFNHKPNSLFMSFEKLKETLFERDFPELLVSEVLPYEEYTIDTIVEKGRAKLILPRKRTKMNAGISVAGEFEKNEEIIRYCTEILDSLNLDGPIGIQVKRAEDGKYKILEINPRIQGTSVAAIGAGINLPLIAIFSALGKELEIPEIKWGTKFARYYSEVFYI